VVVRDDIALKYGLALIKRLKIQGMIDQMKETEREQATKYAVDQIQEYLIKDYDYTSALLLAAIYVHMRLKSLLTDRLSPDKKQWKEVHVRLGDLLGFRRTVSICKSLGLVSEEMSKNLKELYDMRSEVAHESRIWRELKNLDVEKVKRLCKCAIEFLEETKSVLPAGQRRSKKAIGLEPL
jgi:hypothetical protein